MKSTGIPVKCHLLSRVPWYLIPCHRHCQQFIVLKCGRAVFTNQRLCSCVSGTDSPRVLVTRSKTVLGSCPLSTSTADASKPDLPIPAQQWTTTRCFCSIRREMSQASSQKAGMSSGTRLSGIGNDRKSMPCSTRAACSWERSNSCTSLSVSREMTVSIPEFARYSIWEYIGLPDEGWGMMANEPEPLSNRV